MITIYSESNSFLPVSVAWWQYVSELLAKRCGLQDKNISVSLVSKVKILELNSKYRKVYRPTDVLSFSFTDTEIEGKVPEKFFGEIVISPEVVKENSYRFGVSYSQELQRVIAHGLLHLKGYDHKTTFGVDARKKEEFFERQERLLEENSLELFFPQLVVGLGNVGARYEDTPHNVGFLFIDYIVKRIKDKDSGRVKCTHRFGAELIEILGTPKVMFAKPLGYMNNSGGVVKEICKNVKIDPRESLLIVHDELDMRLGTSKFSFGSSGKTHKGIKSIEERIKTKKFWRLRIGVDTRVGREISGENFVLDKFSGEKKKKLSSVFENSYRALLYKFNAAGFFV